jgi:uncharacterized RDD family membrane protein YckC
MSISLQKASFWKRISAYMFDAVLAVMLTIGLALAFNGIFQYDKHLEKLEGYQFNYEQEYGIDFNITEEDYNKLSETEQQKYTDATKAFRNDAQVIALYDTMFYSALAIVSVSLLLAHLILYFAVPLFIGYGQTLGKKIFGIAVVRTSFVKTTNFVLFTRAIVGQCIMETMVPVLFVLMAVFGLLGSVGTIAILLLWGLNIYCMITTQTNSTIHDLLSDTVVVDMISQRIFETEEELIEYKKELQREEAAKAEY